MPYMKERKGKLLAVAISTVVLSGCFGANSKSNAPPLSAEERALQQQMAQMVIDRMRLKNMELQKGLASSAPIPDSSESVVSEEKLVQQILALPSRDVGVVVEHKKDGFTYDGQLYVDPEGSLVDFGVDALSGNVTYLVDQGRGYFSVKFNRVGVGSKPVKIATAQRDAGGWRIETVTGKKLHGQRLILTSKGVVVARDQSAFTWQPGGSISTFVVPDGYHIADFQNGDVASTGFILLEKDLKEKNNSFAKLVGSVKGLANSLGVVEESHYLLANLHDDRRYPIGFSARGKETSYLSGCQKSGGFGINKCSNVSLKESLYKQNGLPNWSHYYWSISWVNSPKGALLVAKESGGRKLSVIDLGSNKKVLAFERALGINGFKIIQHPDGQIDLKAKLGLSWEEISDLRSFLDSQQIASSAEF